MNLILRQYRVLNSTWTWFLKICWSHSKLANWFMWTWLYRKTHPFGWNDAGPPSRSFRGLAPILGVLAFKLARLESGPLFVCLKWEKTLGCGEKGGHLTYYSSRKEIYNIILAYSIMMFLLTDSNFGKHIVLRTLFGIHFSRKMFNCWKSCILNWKGRWRLKVYPGPGSFSDSPSCWYHKSFF